VAQQRQKCQAKGEQEPRLYPRQKNLFPIPGMTIECNLARGNGQAQPPLQISSDRESGDGENGKPENDKPECGVVLFLRASVCQLSLLIRVVVGKIQCRAVTTSFG
jgi:hypothetical protein